MSTYITFKKVCKYHGIPEKDWQLNGQYNYIKFFNGSQIDLLDVKETPTDPDFERFGSLEYTGGALEEAGEIKFKAFDVLKSRVGRHLNKELNIPSKLLITANPTKNWLKRTFYNPWKKGDINPKYAFVEALYSDNHYTADEYGENLSEISDLVTRQRLKDGNWDYSEDNDSLFNTDDISDLFTNPIEETEDKWMIVDAARFGGDKIVIMCWQGLKAYKIVVRQKQGTDRTAQDIRDLSISEKIPYSHILVDEDGVGGGIVDHLKGIKGFVNNSSPLERREAKKVQVMQNGKLTVKTAKDNYQNLRSQCYYILSEKIANHEIAIETQDQKIIEAIHEELEQIKRKDPDTDNKLAVIPKDEIKENLGHSPDYADTLMMRMYFLLDFSFKSKTNKFIKNKPGYK